jgi:transcriptional regulator with XRE-family HTH domain
MAENLWALREQRRLSVATLASRAGLPIGLITEYESGTRSVDPRHLSRLARALYVEEADIKMRCDPRPGMRSEARPAPPAAALSPSDPPASDQPLGGKRVSGPPRLTSESRAPAPARPSQITHLNDLIQRLGRDRAVLEAELGKPLEQLDRLAASALLGRLQAELRTAPSPERRRAYLPEAVDQYESCYLTAAKNEDIDLHFTLFDGSKIDGRVAGFSTYSITVRLSAGGELTLNKLAIVSYAKHPGGQYAEAKGRDQ